MHKLQKKKKSPKWQIALLIILIIINLSIPARHLLKRTKYTKWPDDLYYDELHDGLLNPLKMKHMQEEQFDDKYEKNCNNNKQDKFFDNLMKGSKIDQTMENCNNELYFAHRQLGMLEYNIENSVFLKTDIERFRNKYRQARKDGIIKVKEVEIILDSISKMNNNSIPKLSLQFWKNNQNGDLF
ncbi:MAG: hypothetical protein ACLFSQ_03650 [Candidatus Zixiibacteriota bacterium]